MEIDPPSEMPILLLAYSAIMIPVFSAIRLAKFNSLSNMRESKKYIGLPTPANGILICSSILYVNNILFRQISNFVGYDNYCYRSVYFGL